MTRRRGFTLIELLIVVAIISMLVSILLPSLVKARQMARRAVCGTGLRGLQLANETYSGRWRGFYVRGAADITSTNLRRWHGRRKHVNQAFDPLEGPMADYLGDGRIKECPSFVEVLRGAGQSGGGFEAGCGGYGYNNQYIGGRSDRYGWRGAAYSARASEVTRASETVMFTDAAYLQQTSSGRAMIEYSFCEPPYWDMPGPAGMSYRPNPTIHFRHLGTVSVGWSDGHVSWEPMTFSGDYQTHSGASAGEAKQRGLGWFGPESNELFDLQ